MRIFLLLLIQNKLFLLKKKIGIKIGCSLNPSNEIRMISPTKPPKERIACISIQSKAAFRANDVNEDISLGFVSDGKLLNSISSPTIFSVALS